MDDSSQALRSLPHDDGQPAHPLPPPKPKLRAATSLLVFVLFIAGQLLASVAIVIVLTVSFAISGGDLSDRAAFTRLTEDSFPLIAVAGALGGALGLAMGALVLRKTLRDPSPYGAAWNLGSLKGVLVAGAWGAAAGAAYLAFSLVVPPPEELGPLARMAQQPGLGRVLWIFLALVVAPPVEELLFRGILLGGLNQSFGVGWGASLNVLAFVVLHIPEALYYWPAFIGVGLLAVVATWQRLARRTAIVAIASHVSYNAVVTLASFAGL